MRRAAARHCGCGLDPAALARLTAGFLGARRPPGCGCCCICPPSRSPGSGLPGSGLAGPLPPRTLRRLQDTVLRCAADVLSGPAGLAAFLRTGLLGGQFPAVSLPLEAGAATSTVPPHLRRAVIARDRHPSTSTWLPRESRQIRRRGSRPGLLQS